LRDGSNLWAVVGSSSFRVRRGVFTSVIAPGRRRVPPARVRRRRVCGVLLDCREDEGPCVGGPRSPLRGRPGAVGMELSDAPTGSGAARRGPATCDAACAAFSRCNRAFGGEDDPLSAVRPPESINGSVLRKLRCDALLVRAEPDPWGGIF